MYNRIFFLTYIKESIYMLRNLFKNLLYYLFLKDTILLYIYNQ